MQGAAGGARLLVCAACGNDAEGAKSGRHFLTKFAMHLPVTHHVRPRPFWVVRKRR